MATLEKRSGKYRIVFRFNGAKYSRSLKTDNQTNAEACLARVEDNLHRLQIGTLALPDVADVVSFLLSDGRQNGKSRQPKIKTLRELFDAYVEGLPSGSIEDSTLDCMRIHMRHVARLLGKQLSLRSLEPAHLQEYVERRSKEKGLHGKTVGATTIKKELVTFNTVWSWAARMGHVDRQLPKDGLKYPKTTERPPFQTWEEIERKINRGGLTEAEQGELWDSLFLTLPEIAELLQFVQGRARHPFVYPMFVFAAHTGARRSEMLRSEIDDVSFESKTILIREKKRVKGKRTTRRVPMSPILYQALQEWIARHPGGSYTLCHQLEVPHSKVDRTEFRPLTGDEARDHFKRTLAGSKWEKLRGWHVFRHSFCSNCAAKGIDQRIINAWVGHQTEEMVRRYRHLIPDQQQSAILTVFGGNGQQAVVANA